MKKILLNILPALALFGTINTTAQVSSPITSCPTVLAVARSGFNNYNNEPVFFYSVNPFTGTAVILPGGPLKDPANPAANIDFNATGINGIDGYIYGIRPGIPDQKFYRVGSNYSRVLLGSILPPTPQAPANYSSVNPAAGEFDGSGNYYFTAGTGTMNANGSYNPTDFYIGKITAAASLVPGAGNIAPTYSLVNFTTLACGEFYSTLQAPIGFGSQGNTGIRDLVFNPRDGQLYTYVSYEYPIGSGTFKGQLLRINGPTGDIFCYPSSVLPFANTSNEVAGTAITPNGEILILFTGGDMYKTVSAGPGYTGAITYQGPSGITGGLRGDLAACVTSGSVVPVRITNVAATENNCMINVRWAVSGEQNVSRYNVEEADRNGFVSVSQISATNQAADHSYSVAIPVTSKSMKIRLKQTDLDGSISYAEIVSVNTICRKTKNMTVLNSAAVRNNLHIRWNNFQNAETVSLGIYNSTGARFWARSITVNGVSGSSELDVSALPAGAYLVRAQAAGGENFTERFIKN